jgi:hypothetical protein
MNLRGSTISKRKKLFLNPYFPKRFWDPCRLLSNGTFIVGKRPNGELTSHIHLVRKSRIVDIYSTPPILHCVVLN